MLTPLHVIHDGERAATALHPLRLRLLGMLARPDSATGLARRLGMPRQKVNYHLRQLEADHLVEPAGERQRRGCTERLLRAVARSYVIAPDTLGGVATDPEQIRDTASSAYLVAVAARTIDEVAQLRARADRARKKLPTLTLQTEVTFSSPEDQRRFSEELTEAVARLAARYTASRAPDGRTFRVVAGAYPRPKPERTAPAVPEEDA